MQIGSVNELNQQCTVIMPMAINPKALQEEYSSSFEQLEAQTLMERSRNATTEEVGDLTIIYKTSSIVKPLQVSLNNVNTRDFKGCSWKQQKGNLFLRHSPYSPKTRWMMRPIPS